MSQSFVKPYALHDDDTCLVNHLLNAWFCTNANHICFSKCLLSLLFLKESLDSATFESAHSKLDDDDYLVNIRFYTAKPSLSHGDLVFDPRSDLSQGGGDDAEHPTVISMYTFIAPQAPSGPTRLKVNPFLFEVYMNIHWTWLLPHHGMLCIIRYKGNHHQAARKLPEG